MSWFDTSGFASLAKSALKEAQKTIDKALDIKEEEQRAKTPAGEGPDFFASWGIKSEEGETLDTKEEKSTSQKPEPGWSEKATTSIWGSFTGSFFEPPKSEDGAESARTFNHSQSLQSPMGEAAEGGRSLFTRSAPGDLAPTFEEPTALISETGLDMSEFSSFLNESDSQKPEFAFSPTSPRPGASRSGRELDSISLGETNDTFHEEAFSKSQLVVDLDEDRRRDSIERREDERREKHEIYSEAGNIETRHSNCDNETGSENRRKTSEVRRREPTTANHSLNRVSVVSSESDKKSSESVEVLDSQSGTDTGCTTTPESDSNSICSSATGMRITSESVEILPDSSVTSPSSVEILGDWKSDSSPFTSPMDQRMFDVGMGRGDSVTPFVERKDALTPGERKYVLTPSCSDISPYESPLEEAKTLNLSPGSGTLDTEPSPSISPVSPECLAQSVVDSNKISPDSVEVIPETDESEELSLAEDSYTSASESTVMTIRDNLHQLEQAKPKVDFVDKSTRMHDSCPDSRQGASRSDPDPQLNLSLDSLKEKHSLHLPLAPITTQPVHKPENLEAFSQKVDPVDVFDPLKCTTIEPPDPDTFQDDSSQLQKVDVNDAQEQPLMLTDSSCEGTLIESSSEDNATLICEAEPKVAETTLTASSYVKNMLADAMVEKGENVDLDLRSVDAPRENSPISSESRSDLVKIGSDQTSGHTSGDELETTTSSDIEIISRYSPNGDSSSTQSRQSPAKLVPNKSSDLLAKTLNKVRGHSRELSEISVGSDDANLEIEKLLKRVQEMTEILEARQSKLIDVSRMNMELHEQNNILKSQLDGVQKRAAENQDLDQIADEYTQRLSALERKFQQAIRERDTIRKQMDRLKQEAATRLSTQEMSTMSAEKDEIIKELREEGEKLSKQQLQHSNIIKKLRAKEKENDSTIKNQKDQIDEQSLELERLKRSLNAKEEVERSQIEAVHTLTARTKKQEKEIMSLQEKLDDALQKMDTYKKSLDAAKADLAETKQNLLDAEGDLKEAVENAGESCQLSAQVQELKMKLRQAEEACVKREEAFRQENSELLKRLESSEARSEELSQSVTMATKPLLRQLEQLQSNLSHKTNSFMKQEKTMSEKIAELQTKLETVMEMDRSLREENLSVKTKLSSLESRTNAKELEKQRLEKLCSEMKEENSKLADENEQQRQMLKTLEQSHSSQVKELRREINSLENKLSVEKAATDAEKRRNHAMLEQQQSVEEELRLSPTLSIGRDSVSSSNSVWPAFNDSMFDSSSGRFPNVYDSMRSGANSTSMFENLQAQLKQRDGEVQQLQWELSRRNVERDALNTELSKLALKVEDLSAKVREVETLNEHLNDIQTKYDALLQMYGEKVEESQELRLDLEDVKEMYKTQIDQLLKREV